MSDTVQRQIFLRLAQVVEHQDGAALQEEELLKCNDFAAVTQLALRQQADFRQTVDHHE